MIESKTVQKFGNGGHIVLSKEYVGRKVKFLIERKSFNEIKSEILDILEPYLENVLGVYLYGSYARNEETIDSDIDILVVVDKKIKINNFGDYSITSVSLEELERTLKENAVLLIPILREARTIINPELLERYKSCKFTKSNTKVYLESCNEIIELNKKGIEMDFDIGSIVYSLILRIRGLFMIKNESYSKASFFNFLEKKGMKAKELYDIYSRERAGIKVKESSVVGKEDLKKLVKVVEELLIELK